MSLHDDYQARASQPSDIVDHLPTLYERTSIEGATIIELGVRTGNSTAAFLAAAERYGGHVWSVDITYPAVPVEWFDTDLWTLTVGDDLLVAGLLPDAVDVLFIDTSHHFAHTLAELRTYGPKVKPGGVILLHDTELERPEQSPPDDPPFPVAKAIEAWTVETCRTWVNHLGCYGLGEIFV